MAAEGVDTFPGDEGDASSGVKGFMPDSSVRSRATASRATRRVADYLRALGLKDPVRIQELSQNIIAEVGSGDLEQQARLAVTEAQKRFEHWRAGLLLALPNGVNPLWLREFIGAHPSLFLGDVEAAQIAAHGFGDARAGHGPRHARFRAQSFEPAEMPPWLPGLLAPMLLAWAATQALWSVLSADGWSLLEFVWTSLYAGLFFLGAVGFSVAAIGFVGQRKRSVPASRVAPAEGSALPRTALAMPIYHENAEDVFAALAGMRESLAVQPGGSAFEIFVLSDSRDPEVCAEEERAFRRVAASSDATPIYYHRRAHNERQKAGNLAEFFESWGPRYKYVIVLDADSIMTGATLVELVRRMETAPKVAVLQAPLVLHRGETLFARVLQFASSVAGPGFTRGLSIWSGPHGNYYGHNAVIRVSAFLDCCALPTLNGEPPLGGHVLSHDFVEAALLCREGWEVRTADDIEGGGSYEGLPQTLPEYVSRDRRWCQGNLQHLRIAPLSGFRPMSRIHMILGACSYLAGPTWLLFLVLGVLLFRRGGVVWADLGVVLAASTLLVLVGPFIFGLLTTLRTRARRTAHGGAVRLALSTLLAVVLGSVLAPILMLHHTRNVLSILTGHAILWGSQQRHAVGNVTRILLAESMTTLLGVGTALCLWWDSPELLGWLAPVWLPWACAIPIGIALSSAVVGRFARKLGLLWVPTETTPDELLLRIDELRVLTRSDASARFRDLVLDPVLVATHIARLEGKHSVESPRRLAELRRRALREGPASLSLSDWKSLADDVYSMRLLHREAWRRWPVESWELAREARHVPPEITKRSPIVADDSSPEEGDPLGLYAP